MEGDTDTPRAAGAAALTAGRRGMEGARKAPGGGRAAAGRGEKPSTEGCGGRRRQWEGRRDAGDEGSVDKPRRRERRWQG